MQIVNVGVVVENKEPACAFGRNVICSHYGEQYGDSVRKLKTELLHDPAVSFLVRYVEKTKQQQQQQQQNPKNKKHHKKLLWNGKCTSMFIAVLFITAKARSQLK